MFGHQNDVISQDQQNDANVQIPDSTMQALTVTPSDDSALASPAPVATDDDGDNSLDTPAVPPLTATSVDGFSAPSTKLSSPFAYMQDSGGSNFPSSGAQSQHSAPYLQEEDEQPDNGLADREEERTIPNSTDQEVDVVPESIPMEVTDEEDIIMPKPAEPAKALDNDTTIIAPGVEDKLLEIKDKALGELSPLVSKLDLTPEDKFHTLMMLIRSSDNQTLISDAYDAAKKIPDEKERAQALFDIVKEIDYFTGNQG